MTRSPFIRIVAALLLAACCHAAAADILDQVPADAAAIVRIKTLDKTNAKLKKLMKAVGAGNTFENDPIDTYFRSVHLTKGVDRSGDLASIYWGESIDLFNADQQMVALVPVSDYQAFLGNFPDPKTGADGITAVNDADPNKKGFIANWGEYAAISSNKDLIAKKPGGLKLYGPAADEFAKHDLALYIRMDRIRDAALVLFKGDDQEIAEDMMGELPQLPASCKPLQDLLDQMLIGQSRQFLTDDNAVAVGMDVSDDGVLFTAVADFKPGSKLAKFAASLTSTSQSLLAGLPDKPYGMLGGAALSLEMKQQIIAMLIDPMSAHLDMSDPASKPIAELLTALRGIFTSTDTVAGGLIRNPDEKSKSSYQIVRVAIGDAGAIKKSYVDGWAAITELIHPPGAVASQPGTILDLKPHAATVDDVQFDQFSLIVSPGDASASQPDASIFGADQLAGWIGTASTHSTLITIDVNPTDPLLHDSIIAAKTGKDVLSASKAIRATAAHLPPSRPWEMFVYPGRINALNDPEARPPAADDQPMGISFAGSGDTLRLDVFMPASAIKNLVPAGSSAKIAPSTQPTTTPGQ